MNDFQAINKIFLPTPDKVKRFEINCSQNREMESRATYVKNGKPIVTIEYYTAHN